MKRTKCFLLIFVIFVLTVIDQYTKYFSVTHLSGQKDIVVIPGILSFSYVENPGMAWGMLAGGRILFILITCILMIAILFLIVRIESWLSIENNISYRMLQADFVLLTAGALGNLIDRMKNGYVVDFIKTDFIDFPVFNVADCYVTISMAVLMILILFFIKEEDFNRIFSIKPINKKDRQ